MGRQEGHCQVQDPQGRISPGKILHTGTPIPTPHARRASGLSVPTLRPSADECEENGYYARARAAAVHRLKGGTLTIPYLMVGDEASREGSAPRMSSRHADWGYSAADVAGGLVAEPTGSDPGPNMDILLRHLYPIPQDPDLNEYQKGLRDGLIAPLLRLQQIRTGDHDSDATRITVLDDISVQNVREYARMVHDRVRAETDTTAPRYVTDRTMFFEGYAMGLQNTEVSLQRAWATTQRLQNLATMMLGPTGNSGYRSRPY